MKMPSREKVRKSLWRGFWFAIAVSAVLTAIFLATYGCGRKDANSMTMESAEAYTQGGMIVKEAFEAELGEAEKTSKDAAFLAQQILDLQQELEKVKTEAKNSEARLKFEILQIRQEVESRRPQVFILFDPEGKPEVRAGDPLEKVEPEVPYAADPFGAAAPGTPEFPEAADPFGAAAPADPFAQPSEPEAGSADPFGEPSRSTKAWTAKEAEQLDDLFGPPAEKKKGADKGPSPAEDSPDMRKQA